MMLFEGTATGNDISIRSVPSILYDLQGVVCHSGPSLSQVTFLISLIVVLFVNNE